MDNMLVKWNTGRIIEAELEKLMFFKGYKGINTELYDLYTHLVNYSSLNYNSLSHNRDNFGFKGDAYISWVEHLDKMLEFQRFVISEEGNSEAGVIASRAKQVFGDSNVAEAYCADLHVLEQLEELLNYSESVRNLFNYVVPLVQENFYSRNPALMQMETEQEIRLILEAKGLGDYEVPTHLLVTTQTNLN